MSIFMGYINGNTKKLTAGVDCINDNKISWKAKGIYCYLVSLDFKSRINITSLDASFEGVESVASGIKELISAGYIRRERMRTNRGYNYYIYDSRNGDGLLNHLQSGVECSNADQSGFVYVGVDTYNNLVKIGFSTNLKKRFKVLKSSNPGIRLHSYYEGTRQDEHNLHEMFISKGVHEFGEWFRIDWNENTEIENYFKSIQK